MRNVLLALPAIVFAAGCSGNAQSQAFLSATRSGAPPAGSAVFAGRHEQLYVAGGIDPPGYVTVFNQAGDNQKPVRQITQGIDGPICVFIDRSGNTYVGNYSGGNVTVYAAGASEPSTTLTGAGKPISVVAADDGTAYVANIGNGDEPPSNASILVYPKGQTTPSKVLPFSAHTFPAGLTLDSHGNLYAAFNRDHRDAKGITRYRGDIYKFSHVSFARSNLNIRAGHVGQLAIDKGDNLLLVDNKCNCIDVFAPGSGQLTKQISGPFSNAIFGVAINRNSDEIWVTDAFGGEIYGLSYPDGKPKDDIAPQLGWTLGIATSPDPLRR